MKIKLVLGIGEAIQQQKFVWQIWFSVMLIWNGFHKNELEIPWSNQCERFNFKRLTKLFRTSKPNWKEEISSVLMDRICYTEDTLSNKKLCQYLISHQHQCPVPKRPDSQNWLTYCILWHFWYTENNISDFWFDDSWSCQ